VPASAPVYIFAEGEILLEAPLEDVWPHVLDYGAWQNFATIRHVSGEPHQEGEVMLLAKEEAGLVFKPYYARTIKLEPGRRVVWKTYREETGGFGIIDFRVQEAQGGTRFSWNLLYEYVVAYQDESELEAFRRQHGASIDKLATTVFPKLKKLVERTAVGS
jgi:hypothetical protein